MYTVAAGEAGQCGHGQVDMMFLLVSTYVQCSYHFVASLSLLDHQHLTVPCSINIYTYKSAYSICCLWLYSVLHKAPISLQPAFSHLDFPLEK